MSMRQNAKPTANELSALLRRDFDTFVERSFYELNPHTNFHRNWHISLIATKLEAVRRGEIRRLIITSRRDI
jgi:hypothetical protein